MKTFREFLMEMDPRTRMSIKPQVIRVDRPSPPPKKMPVARSKIVDSPNAIKSGSSILGAIRSLRSPAALAGATLGNILSTPPNPTGDATLKAAKMRGDYSYKSKNPDGPIGPGGQKYL